MQQENLHIQERNDTMCKKVKIKNSTNNETFPHHFMDSSSKTIKANDVDKTNQTYYFKHC